MQVNAQQLENMAREDAAVGQPVDSFEQQQLARQDDILHQIKLIREQSERNQGDMNILRQLAHETHRTTAMTESHVIDNGRLVKKNLEISTKNFEVTTEIRGLAGHTQESLMHYFSSRGADLEAMEVQRAEMVARYARSVGTDRIAPCASLPPLTEICLALVSAGSMRRWT